MSGGSFFLTLGGLGISLAGFAGLLFAVASDPEDRDPVTTWRFRSIVFHGFRLAVIGLSAFPAWELTGSQDHTMRIVSGVAIATIALGFRTEFAAGPAWPSDSERRFTMGIAIVGTLIWAGNLILASTGLVMALLVWTAIISMSVFSSAVKAMETSTEA